MPATNSTFYNMKRLHAVFAVSSMALLAVTLWMLAADHWREWKVYQRTFRDRIEPWLTEARIRETRSGEFTAREESLEEAIRKARGAVPDRAAIQRFIAEFEREALRRGASGADRAAIEAAYESLVAQPGDEAHRELLGRLSERVTAAENRGATVARQLRSHRAQFNEARSLYEAGVGEGVSQQKLDRLQRRVDGIKQAVDALVAQSEEASTHSEALAGIFREITRQEVETRQALADHRALVDRFDRTLTEQRWNFGKQLLRLPLIDAFGRPLAIEQTWLPGLTIDYHFRRVARFDRCATCHQGIDKTRPGSRSEPACLGEEVFSVELAVPAALGQGEGEDGKEEDATASPGEPTLNELCGLELAPRGILDPEEATLGLVRPRTPAADAGLLAGDVIEKIDGVEITDREQARRLLMEAADGPNALKLEIRRGLPHPYSSHLRLDLFVGSLSPHPVSRFGCTICHDGQGSATEFKFASHTPNDPAERVRWRKEHDWFWNQHWDFPMRPRRFAEASCLRCHHAVTDLAPSPKFPDPPAPKLLAGYDLVRQSGCFGCHEIRGVTALGEKVGPDMRLEPNGRDAAKDPLAGTMSKVGPSLRNVAGKLDAVFLDDWLRNPRDSRSDTRMPQFYGVH
ncbi:MAG: PDZ domain-containing protein, partial [Planctomycetota bacterium]